jgi:hypothetical protein
MKVKISEMKQYPTFKTASLWIQEGDGNGLFKIIYKIEFTYHWILLGVI